jgi:anti-anti-sigma regulatory factor
MADLSIIGSIDRVVIKGELDSQNYAYVRRAFAKPAHRGQKLVLDLTQLDIESGEVLAELVDDLRQLRKAVASLTLAGAPQMLCHNLYRVGALDGALRIELVEMRQDEPVAS